MKFIFLDRDGVINRFPGIGEYVTRDADLVLLPNAAKALAALHQAGFEMDIISNQGCVSRKLLSHEDLLTMTGRLLKDIESAGGKIQGVYYCIHQTSDRCDCKKPKTRLVMEAIRGRDADLDRSYFIGDSAEDIETGHEAGCRTILVLSGRSKAQDVATFTVRPDVIKNDLWEAAKWIIEQKKS